MNELINRGLGIIQSLRRRDTEQLLYREMPQLVMDLMRVYFRLEITGLENIPRRGAALITPNHSGYAGFDALMLAHEISKEMPRIPRVMTHHLWFAHPTTALVMKKLGFVDANYKNADLLLGKNNLVVLFPEGELGNFKPSSKMYQLQQFRRGFIRLAIQHGCPIIPTLIIGAEETHINLTQVRLPKSLQNLVLPIPLNIFPLPVKWRIHFLEPIHLPYEPEAVHDRELMHDLADDVRSVMQGALNAELQRRKSVFF